MEEYLPTLERLIDQFRALPGIGRKTAQRLAFRVLEYPEEKARAFADAIIEAKTRIHECECCYNLSEEQFCRICRDPMRDHETVCVVEGVKDLMSLEKVREYHGLYHVLHGVISPRDGVTPDMLRIDELISRIKAEDSDIKEIILATNPTVEGETTSLYLSKLLKPYGVRITRLAYGIPVGGGLEYTDENTLLRALKGRTDFESGNL
ncbi:MAG: recombination protein RecR [Clostridiales bacterium]|jgi:recombination protein RecR|nr:recombination protein RecR [Clostridiales bacterium]